MNSLLDHSKLNVKKASYINKPVSYKGEIMIIDDDPANLDLLLEMLSEQQYDVRVATSGHRGLVAVATSLPDLILLDINMPDMNGYDVCRRLKADANTDRKSVV